ncbi:hypothetical protein F5882DRAFT_440593 [Hyaloscypha sp. PMI_1271]|nr:hypothetical protein F5882DRAFT_440593 [Hyaloscypha sp. PMI_1271]
MATFHPQPEIQLTSMSQVALAVNKEDDWTGLTDAAARRKRQNRLNVRAYRLRKAQALQATAPPPSKHDPASLENQPKQAWWYEDKQMVVAVPAWFAKSFYATIKPVLPNHFSILKLDDWGPTGILFPLSSDHLITLIQYNVLRACLANLRLLDLVDVARTPQRRKFGGEMGSGSAKCAEICALLTPSSVKIRHPCMMGSPRRPSIAICK